MRIEHFQSSNCEVKLSVIIFIWLCVYYAVGTREEQKQHNNKQTKGKRWEKETFTNFKVSS